MTDEIIQDLWQIKDHIAKEHGYNIDSLVEYLRKREHKGNHRNVNLSSIKKSTEQKFQADG